MAAGTAALPQLALLHLLLPVVFHLSLTVGAATFTITNNCPYTVWPAILSGAGSSPLGTTGFALAKGETRSVTVPASWSGRLWGRTLCSTTSDVGAATSFTCATGDCGSGKVECQGGGATPPATLAEFTLGSGGGSGSSTDFYDVSLVDGYNLPMLVAPQHGQNNNCTPAVCSADVNALCPPELRVAGAGAPVACKSACGAFGTPEYCCRGQFANPNTCRPSAYSQVFKRACPGAYSYAYDDGTSIFTCASGGGYAVTFCPSAAPSGSSQSQKAASGPPQTQSPQQQLPPLTNTDGGRGGILFYDSAFFGASAVSSRPSIAATALPTLLAALFWRWLGDHL